MWTGCFPHLKIDGGFRRVDQRSPSKSYSPLTSTQKQATYKHSRGVFFVLHFGAFSRLILCAKIYSPKLPQSSLEGGTSCCRKIACPTLGSEPRTCRVHCCSCFTLGIQRIQTDRFTTWPALRMNNTRSICRRVSTSKASTHWQLMHDKSKRHMAEFSISWLQFGELVYKWVPEELLFGIQMFVCFLARRRKDNVL